MDYQIILDPSLIPDPSGEQLTDEEKAQRLEAATYAMFAAFDVPETNGKKARAIFEARQAKATAAAVAALFAVGE